MKQDYIQPRSQVRSAGTGRREPWERGWTIYHIGKTPFNILKKKFIGWSFKTDHTTSNYLLDLREEQLRDKH